MIESVTKIIVKRRYSPIKGTTSEVDGMISVMTRRKTVSVRRTEMQSVIFSPESDGRYSTSTVRKEINRHLKKYYSLI